MAPARTAAFTVSTIQRAKGTEARLVIVLRCEERRLFYVAATRAKGRLILTRVSTRGGRGTAGPSRFLYQAALRRTPARRAT